MQTAVIQKTVSQGTGAQGPGALGRARILLASGQAAAALAAILPELQRRADDPALLDVAAMCYWRLGDGPTALALMQVLTDGWPQLVDGWTKRAAMAAGSGDTDLAETCLRRALALAPNSVSALVALNRIAPFSRNGALTRRLRKCLGSSGLSAAEREMAHNALARIEERAGRYAAAFRHYTAAKGASPAQYEAEATERRVAGQIARFEPHVLHGAPGGPRVTFIVGMPRSGTTLVESILARHPEVTTVGESRALTQARQKFGGAAAGWDWLDKATPSAAEAARRWYLQALGQPVGQGGVLVDKMPLNCFDLGFAAWILPQARFVFLQRHPLDVGLSCFTTNFHEGNGFSRRLDWIGHLTRAVYRSAEDYEAKLGDLFRRQSYHALVETPEAETRALLDHVGLPFDAACLSPEEGQGLARTASLYQVRRKINRDGLDRWKPYDRQLGPLKDALGADWLGHWELNDAALCQHAPQQAAG